MSFCVEDDIDESKDIEDIVENGVDRAELERIVSIYITNYFREKNIPINTDLICPKYIDLCISMDICRGVDIAYSAIEKSGKFETSSSEHSISEDIRFVIKTLGQIKRFVPQEFSAGILLMHLELVEGMQF
jgi:hypothetical protein